jgi:OOP family OmpA-OmpF porin
LALSALTVGQSIRFQHMIFEQGTAQLQNENNDELQALINLLTENPNMEIEIIGHTDIEGNPIENMKLSQERVKAIKNRLVNEGVATLRIKTKAYGSQKPLTRKRDELSKQLNRRVEVKIIKE